MYYFSMAKRKSKPKPAGVNLSVESYKRILMVLLEAWEAVERGEAAYWDFGPGERPQKISQELLHVAKKENIPLKIQRGPRSLALLFGAKKSQDQAFRVRNKEGTIQAEGSI